MNSSRRQFLAGAASAVLPGVLGACGSPRAGGLDIRRLRSKKEVWADVEYMNGLGPRYCGTPSHMAFLDHLDAELEKCGAGLSDIQHTALVQWAPREVSLKTPHGAAPIGAICRWSAVTGPEGVTAPVHYCGRAEGPSRFALALDPEQRWRFDIPPEVKGKIALLEVAVSPRPWGRMYGERLTGLFDKEGNGALPSFQSANASNQTLLPDALEARLKAAGAVGLIYAWAGLSDEDAEGQARLGDGELPSVWVAPSTGRMLRALAESGEPVTLTVDAVRTPGAPTRTIVATLPGASAQSIILWTHTDGQNVVEENGAVAILNMMRYFAKIPRAARNRTIVAVMPEGHFAEQYLPSSAWIDERPELMQNAAAVIALEHLGCMEWISDPVANTYKPTGASEMGFAFCPQPAMQRLAQQAVKDQTIGREAIIGSAQFSLTPGIAPYRRTGVPFAGFTTIPSYLLSEDANGHIEKLSPDLYYEQLKMLIRLTHGVDATPAEMLRKA